MPGTYRVLSNCLLLLFFKSSQWHCKECTLTNWKLTSKSVRTCPSNTWQLMAPWRIGYFVPASPPRCLNVGKRMESCPGLVIPEMSFWVHPGHWRKRGGWCRVSERRHHFGRRNSQPEDCRIWRTRLRWGTLGLLHSYFCYNAMSSLEWNFSKQSCSMSLPKLCLS